MYKIMNNAYDLSNKQTDVSGLIIAEVKRNPQLYDKKHSGFRLRAEKEKIWEQIGLLVNLDPSVVQNKWKNLRDQFAKEKRKVSTRGLSDSEVNWTYFESLKFLSKHVIPRRRSGTKSKHSGSNDQDGDSEAEEDDEEPTMNSSNIVKFVESNYSTSIHPAPKQSSSKNSEHDFERQDSDDDDDNDEMGYDFPSHSIFDATPKKRPKLEAVVVTPKVEAEPVEPIHPLFGFLASDVTFGNMVAERLKEISQRRKNRMKIEITKIIFTESDDE